MLYYRLVVPALLASLVSPAQADTLDFEGADMANSAMLSANIAASSISMVMLPETGITNYQGNTIGAGAFSNTLGINNVVQVSGANSIAQTVTNVSIGQLNLNTTGN